jgi:hypothetical protein
MLTYRRFVYVSTKKAAPVAIGLAAIIKSANYPVPSAGKNDSLARF